MRTFVKSQIVLQEPKKNKKAKYIVTTDKAKPNLLVVKGRSSKGRGTGFVCSITQKGDFIVIDKKRFDYVEKLITEPIKKKIIFLAELLFSAKLPEYKY
jgi:hypothetical protein